MAIPSKTPFWRRTPPAVFPSIFGALGLGIAWMRAAPALGIPPEIGELVFGAATAIFLLALMAYGAKFIRRSAVLIEDLRIVPGRAGLAAMSLSILLLAAGLLGIAPRLAEILLFAGLIGHAVLALLVIRVFASSPPEARQVTPAWHLAFVGFIVAPLSAIPLGYIALGQGIFAGTTIFASMIYGVSLAQLMRATPPAPLRPFLAIHLAPFSLFGLTAVLLGMTGLAWIMSLLAILMLLILLIRLPFLVEAGFSPLWGAFTFPLAAFASLMLAMADQGLAFAILGALALAAASIVNPVIAARVLRLWANGSLAAKTNAAVA